LADLGEEKRERQRRKRERQRRKREAERQRTRMAIRGGRILLVKQNTPTTAKMRDAGFLWVAFKRGIPRTSS
jgi:hypothetical protein